MDLLKHGESAYPADAWVEQQYMKEDAFTAVSFAWQVLTLGFSLGLAGRQAGTSFNDMILLLQLFWDHLYSNGSTTTVSKTMFY